MSILKRIWDEGAPFLLAIFIMGMALGLCLGRASYARRGDVSPSDAIVLQDDALLQDDPAPEASIKA